MYLLLLINADKVYYVFTIYWNINLLGISQSVKKRNKWINQNVVHSQLGTWGYDWKTCYLYSGIGFWAYFYFCSRTNYVPFFFHYMISWIMGYTLYFCRYWNIPPLNLSTNFLNILVETFLFIGSFSTI